jgi:cbb3-type cytochrome oxidase subunit 1
VVVFFGTIFKRKTPHIYVANWFFGAYILTIAILYIVNTPKSRALWLMKAYSAYADVQDAMVQQWYEHKADGFLLYARFLRAAATEVRSRVVATRMCGKFYRGVLTSRNILTSFA